MEGCAKRAVHSTDKCCAHGGGGRCIMEGCTKIAIHPTDKCCAHGGGKRCIMEGCTKIAIYPTDKCCAHEGGKRCIIEGCPKGATQSTDKCKAHGGGKRCIIEECSKSAASPSDKCIAHGGGKRCPNCIDWIDSRGGNSMYDGYCVTCFKRVFPDDPRSKVIHQHTKEIRVRNYINDLFEGFIHDKPLYTNNCNCIHRRRVDHRKLINGTVLAVETDEFGHKYYDKHDEEIRYDDLYMIHSGKWIFIRFNPDNNYDKTDLEDKLTVLGETMTAQIDRIEKGENTELVEIVKLYC